MSRALSITEVRIADDARAAYLAALPERTQRAAAVPAHFWVFEHASERGRFVEFTEAKSEALLAAALGLEHATDCWREVQGG